MARRDADAVPGDSVVRRWLLGLAQPSRAAPEGAAPEGAAPGSCLEAEASEMDASRFFDQCLMPNRPCVVHGATAGWRAQREWAAADGAVDIAAVARAAGDLEALAPVTECDSEAQRHECRRMALRDFFAAWGDRQGSLRLYLKDWHWQQALQEAEGEWYAVPPWLTADWLNRYCAEERAGHRFGDGVGDYRFCYVGQQGSFTPYHVDVFRSYSWSANLAAWSPRCCGWPRPQLGEVWPQATLSQAALSNPSG
eukprot:TRINITY_DN37344_c0_g1_i4.p1 TRINITY_DN37344_c0_g1~~TRINITY_DN37344_c0_g1_i4.p1  ORF type:complete len:272 (+),score=70.88 TRINITY_DN37344_c0_g1_i4:60-818(+)